MKNASNKQDYRKAYEDFQYLGELNPNYRDSKQQKENALAKGIDYVHVEMLNNTDQIIPNRLVGDLLNFNTYGLDGLWIKYHTTKLPNILYDYSMQIMLENIDISPEQVKEKDILKEKQIKDGYKNAIDTNGNIVNDSLGNKIKVDKFKTIRCRFYQYTQLKTAQITGKVSFTDLATKQQINSYPLSSNLIYEHVYASSNGDQRALNTELIPLLKLAALPFPTNEQMVYDAGEELKSRLKAILLEHHF